MLPIEHIRQALRRSLDFHGRAARAEYWWFTLAWAIVAAIAAAFDIAVLNADLAADPLSGRALSVAMGLVLIPHLSLSIRRLHDQNMRGWWWLMTLLPYIGILIHLGWMTRIGSQGDNRFGCDPLPEPENPTKYF
jgi:uncharacterized membrane protein YhaH (DUF805 family)